MRTVTYAACRKCGHEKKIVGRGLCQADYMHHWETGTLDEFPLLPREPRLISAEKACAICKIVQPLEHFGKNNRRPDGRGSYCKPCAREKYHRPAVERKRAVERPTEGEQECRECGETKPYSEYYWESDKGRFRYRCKACHAARGREYWESVGTKRQRERQLRKYRPRAHGEQIHRQHHRFGLTEAGYTKLLNEQGGGCAICKRTPEELGRVLSVDHCHTNGHVRGLLCSNCNCGVGMFGDDIERLQAAIKYLKTDEQMLE